MAVFVKTFDKSLWKIIIPHKKGLTNTAGCGIIDICRKQNPRELPFTGAEFFANSCGVAFAQHISVMGLGYLCPYCTIILEHCQEVYLIFSAIFFADFTDLFELLYTVAIRSTR